MTGYVAYFDESGTHDGAGAVTVAGYVAPADQWQRFSGEWRDWLDKFGLQTFHMTDWSNGYREFAGWPPAKRHDLFEKLVGTIKLRTHYGFSAATILEDYKEFADELTRRFPMAVSAYTFCILQTLWFVGAWADRYAVGQPIDYVFESGAGHKAELIALVKQVEEQDERRRRFHFGSFTLADKRVRLPLQAADILAYETWKEMENHIVPGEERRPIRKSAEILLLGNDHRYRHGYFDRVRLKEGLESDVREA